MRNNIHNTYNRLRNGDKKYIKILNQIGKYKMTDGRWESQIEIYLNPQKTKVRFIVYIAMLVTLAIGMTLLFLTRNVPTILTFIPLIILIYAAVQVINLQKFLHLAQDYKNVEEFFDIQDPKMVADEFNKQYGQNKRKKK